MYIYIHHSARRSSPLPLARLLGADATRDSHAFLHPGPLGSGRGTEGIRVSMSCGYRGNSPGFCLSMPRPRGFGPIKCTYFGLQGVTASWEIKVAQTNGFLVQSVKWCRTYRRHYSRCSVRGTGPPSASCQTVPLGGCLSNYGPLFLGIKHPLSRYRRLQRDSQDSQDSLLSSR